MLTDLTEGIILATKHNYGGYEDLKDCIKHFLSDFCGSPIEEYSDKILNTILQTCFCDYMQNADYRYTPMMAYFSYKDNSYQLPYIDTMDETNKNIYAILTAFLTVQVRNNAGYVNGFHDFEFKDINLHL